MRFAIAVLLLAATVSAVPSGFLMVFSATDGVANHLFPFAVNVDTGAAKQLGEDYVMASVQNTPNGGSFNPAVGKVQFVGQSLTMKGDNGTEPNPTMNFLTSVDANGDYSSLRLVSRSGSPPLGVRINSAGAMFGMEQAVSGVQDARLDLIEDSGLCNNIVNTTNTLGFNPGHIALDPVTGRFFVSVKKSASVSTLLTIDTSAAHVTTSVDLAGSPVRVTACWDTTTKALYSLERSSASASDSQVVKLDHATGKATTVATITGKATVGDCNGGFFFATGTNGSNRFVANVNLATGAVSSKALSVSPAPVVAIFFPQ